MTDIDAVYDRFFALGGPPTGTQRPWHYRRKMTSLRLSGCRYLAALIRERRPARVLDLGSGMTTHVIRTLQRDEFPEMVVITTDTSHRWLQTTIDELIRDKLGAEQCFEQPDFEKINWKPFDLISVDCGDTAYRISLVPQLPAWCAPGGILVLDDWHTPHYARAMEERLKDIFFTVTPHPVESLDEFGGFVATAERI